MRCLHGEAADTSERWERTAFGYRRFRCRTRKGSSMSGPALVSTVVYPVALWRVRYKLSLRDLPEMFLERGVAFTCSGRSPFPTR